MTFCHCGESIETHFEENIVEYRRAQLDSWILGDKSLVPHFVDPPTILTSQPSYHFAEMFVLRWLHEHDGWLGFSSYAIGPQFPKSARRLVGRRKVEEVVPAERLRALRSIRSSPALLRSGAGEPDLFLYRPDGSFMFVEVKKQGDRMSDAQLLCLAQLRAVLKCPVGIVYALESGRVHLPRRFALPTIAPGERAT